jgi:hypothetical protein
MRPVPKIAAPVEASPSTAGSELIDPYPLHGAPACQSRSEWSPGEQRAFERAEVTSFVQAAHKSPKNAAKGARRALTSAAVKRRGGSTSRSRRRIRLPARPDADGRQNGFSQKKEICPSRGYRQISANFNSPDRG